MNANLILFMALLVVIAIVVCPFINIWAVNTLFGTAIPYTIKTWFASFVLSALIYGPTSKGKQ